MKDRKISLKVMALDLAVVRLPPAAPFPVWAQVGELSSITRTPAELSVVCAAHAVPPGTPQVEGPWRALGVDGPLDFALTGILAAIATPLAAEKISIFAVSTFDTDYVLVKADRLAAALACLRAAGLDC